MSSFVESTEQQEVAYRPIALDGLEARDAVSFPLFLQTSADSWVLYRDVGTTFDIESLCRLRSEGVECLYIREADRGLYFAHVEHTIDGVLRNRRLSTDERADVLCGVILSAAKRLFGGTTDAIDTPSVDAMARILGSGSAFFLREPEGLLAVRRQLAASEDLADHSVRVAMLSMGLGHKVLGADPAVLRTCGLAGLLHDIGRLQPGGEGPLRDDDPDHVNLGADRLAALGLPADIVNAARFHHERHDGSGEPFGLVGDEIPMMAQIVGIADVFDELYAQYGSFGGAYEVLRLIAQDFRGAFSVNLAFRLVGLFQ
jgi:putative nucleotidyltransferase with HDIG domain